MRTIGIVLARLDSTRLPSKALKDVLGRPLISYAIERARRVPSFADVVIATSTRAVDDALAEYGHRTGITVFRGSAENVAHRCLECARGGRADFFARLNGDSPFVDPALIEEGIGLANGPSGPDLVTNLVDRSFPYGVSVEIVNVATMERIVRTLDPAEAEHVTKRFYDRQADFRLQLMRSRFPRVAAARLVVDTPEDEARFRDVAKVLGGRIADAPYQEVAELYLSRAAPALAGGTIVTGKP